MRSRTRTLPTSLQFNPNTFLHKSERFSIIYDWFSHAQVSRCPSIKQYITNAPEIQRAMPVDDHAAFHHEFNSGEIPYLLFLESQVFLNRALCNFCAQLSLHRAGFLSWGIVTTYYSSFFSTLGLIRLQGKARIYTNDLPNLPRGFFVSISSTTAPRCVVFPNWMNYHKQTFLDFYNAYRLFDLFQNSFADFLSLTNDDLQEEVRIRNMYNYGLETAYRELDTPDYHRPDLRRISTRKILTLLSLVTEPDKEWAYLSRACCRIVLLATISWHLAKGSQTLRQVFEKYLSDRKRLIDDLYGRRTTLGKCLLRFTGGRMHLS